MKKLLSALLLAGAATCAQAQYFQWTYGTASPLEKLTSGHNAYSGGTGHFLMSQTSTGGHLYCVRTDQNGKTFPGAPAFNNIYTIVNATNTVVNNGRGKSLEYVGGGFAVASAYQDPNTNNWGVYLLQLNNAGGVNAIYGFPATTATLWSDMLVTGITESAINPGDVYICGFVRTSAATAYTHVFVMCVSSTGVLNWSNVYDLNNSGTVNNFEIPYGIVESTNFNAGSSTWELMVAGTYWEDLGGGNYSEDGFILRIDYANGNVIGNTLYGTAASRDGFTCIRNSPNTNIVASGDGYVLSGMTDINNGTYDYWFVAIDQAGNVAWTNTFDYSGLPGSNADNCYDIIERFNTSAQYEYYLTGNTSNGPFGFTDVMVIKADQNGNGVAGGEFLYGTGNADYGRQSDQMNGFGANNDGLSIYAMSDMTGTASYDLYLIKAYFNGVTACSYVLNNPNQGGGPGMLSTTTPTTPDNYSGATLSASITNNGGESNICYAGSIGSGSNVRQGQVKAVDPLSEKGFVIQPNPSNTAGGAEVKFTKPANGSVEVRVVDLLGRMHYSAAIRQGEAGLKLPALSAGTYLVVVQSGEVQQKSLLLVK